MIVKVVAGLRGRLIQAGGFNVKKYYQTRNGLDIGSVGTKDLLGNVRASFSGKN